MRIDPSRAIGAYAAVTTLAVAWLTLGGAIGTEARLRTIDVERINVREPDGTLRMTIAGHARMPGAIVGGREYRHPNRPEAGMIFYNDEATENGGLVFEGRSVNGTPTNSGSLTFDRWRQDQTIQMVSEENGIRRRAGFVVNDQPDAPMDFPAATRIMQMPPGSARDAAIDRANLRSTQRAYLGRNPDGASQLLLRDATGRTRLRLSVAANGASGIDLLDASGAVTRHIP